MRRPYLLGLLLLSAPAWGVELVRPTAPVQLSFNFAAPVAAPIAASPAPLAAVAALTAAPTPLTAAPAPFAVAAGPAIAAAPSARPAVAAEEAREDGRSQLERAAAASESSNAGFEAPRRTTKLDYEEFGRQVAARPGLSLNPFQHADAKRNILSASGYTHLYGAGGRRVPLAQAADVRVGKAFLSVKKTFDRRPKK